MRFYRAYSFLAGFIVRKMPLSFIPEMALIGGIVMRSVGTYLGGVWTNKS